MNLSREILTGLVAGVIMIILVIGGIGIAITESQTINLAQPIAQAFTSTPIAPQATQPFSTLPSLTNTPTQQINDAQVSGSISTPSITPQPTNTRTISPTPPEDCPPPSGWEAVMINPGDTIESLAEKYNVSTEELQQANCLITEEIIAGSMIYVPAIILPSPIQCGPPAGWVRYRIQSGDTLFSLAQRFRVTVSELRFANCMGSSNLILTGDYLYVPNVITSTPELTATGTEKPQDTSTNTPEPPTPTLTNTPTITDTATPEPIVITEIAPSETSEGG